MRFDAVLAEQATKARDLIAQGRKVQVRRCPLLLAGVFLVEQLTLFVAQRRGRLEVLGVAAMDRLAMASWRASRAATRMLMLRRKQFSAASQLRLYRYTSPREFRLRPTPS